jgi:hypothetical protein
LIQRYATSAILPTVQRVYESAGVGRWACSIQSSLLAYILRVDPQLGGELLNKALAARSKESTRCYTSALADIAKLEMNDQVEAAALIALEEKDPEVVSQAANVLREFGSPAVEARLWQRLEKWNSERASMAVALKEQQPGLPVYSGSSNAGEALIELGLQQALSRGQQWLIDSEKLKRLRSLCLTDNCRTEVDQTIGVRAHDIGLAVNTYDDVPYAIRVGHYELKSIDLLKQKLLQFPRGTVFTWSGSGDDDRIQKHVHDLRKFLDEHGMKLLDKEKPLQNPGL